MNPRRFFVARGAALAIILLFVGFFLLNKHIYTEKQGSAGFQAGYQDISYMIDGIPVVLVGGYAEQETAPGSASKTITRYFGNEAEGDLNGDGVSDVAFLLTQETGGSGTFYYVVSALKTDSGYQGTNAVFLGDRIAPQGTEIRDGEIIVDFATRRDNEPMAAVPSVGVSKYVKLVSGELMEINAVP